MPFQERHSSYPATPGHGAVVALSALLATGGSAAEPVDAPKPKAQDADAGAAAASPNQAGREQNQPLPQSSIRPTDPPPPSLKEARGPDVTLIAGDKRTVYEYRQNGKLRMIKVVPQGGKPYFLVPRNPTSGFGDLEQADTLVPRWVLIEF